MYRCQLTDGRQMDRQIDEQIQDKQCLNVRNPLTEDRATESAKSLQEIQGQMKDRATDRELNHCKSSHEISVYKQTKNNNKNKSCLINGQDLPIKKNTELKNLANTYYFL